MLKTAAPKEPLCGDCGEPGPLIDGYCAQCNVYAVSVYTMRDGTGYATENGDAAESFPDPATAIDYAKEIGFTRLGSTKEWAEVRAPGGKIIFDTDED